MMMMTEILLAMKHEVMIFCIIFLLLFWKIRSDEPNAKMILWVVNGLLLVSTLLFFVGSTNSYRFNEMFFDSASTHFQKSMLSLAMLLVSGMSTTWLLRNKNLIEFYLLLLSSLMGMFFMVSSGNMLMFYLGLELSTIPLAAAANFDLEKRKSSEAAMKLILSSAFSSALLLMGISFIYGLVGSLQFSAINTQLHASGLSLFAMVLVFAGFAFKMSVVPFHLWTADVYEGSPVPVTAFLSVLSKSAVVFIFMNVLFQVFLNLYLSWLMVVSLLAFLTIAIGNLFALRQQNIKRFLAFSSVAQMGYLLVALVGYPDQAQAAITYFLLIYVFSNLAAFGVVGIISEHTGKENIDDYKGFYQKNKFLSWTLAIALFSLAGVPPTAGFFGKLFLLLSGASKGNYVLIVLAALNLVISFYYYLRIVRAIFMDENSNPIEKTEAGLLPRIALYICLGGILLLGLYGPAYEYIATIVPHY